MKDVNLIDMDNESLIDSINEEGKEEMPSSYFGKFKKSLKNSGLRILWLFLLILYDETIFHVWAFGGITLTFFVKIAMCLTTACILSLLVSYFPGKHTNNIINWIVSIVIPLIYAGNIIYRTSFQSFFSIQFVEKTNMKVVQYYREILHEIAVHWLVLALVVLVPIVVLIILTSVKAFKLNRTYMSCCYINILIFLLAFGLIFVSVLPFGKNTSSPYDLIINGDDVESLFKVAGVMPTEQIEIRNILFPKELSIDDEFEVWVDTRNNEANENENIVSDISDNDVSGQPEIEEVVEEVEPEPVIDTSPNILDIDFASLAEQEPNETVAAIHRYIASLEPSYKNEYTGMFKGFNLIFLTAESFSNIAVDENLTPTLYKIIHEGFVFNNFYNPRTGGSTSDGEFVCSTSLEPTNGGAKNFRIVGQNSMPFALGNIFNRTYGITSRAYHDNDYMYYGRDITYPGMGYYYQGVGNGLEIPKHWPSSDLDMMKATIPEYIDDDIFHVYYMTVSGHKNYNYAGNYCSALHKDEVADLPYSEPCKAYIACQMELDRALEYLIAQLEEKGIADRTVICFTGDHWPYGLENSEISEILGHDVEETFELYKSNLILWSGAIKEPIEIDKYCVSMDILPTLLNLFGFEYDSRLLMGRDILSDTPSFAPMFSKSFITDKVRYYNNGTVEYLTDEELPEDYVANYKKALSNKWKYSQLIMDTDYYKYICEAAGIEITPVEQNYTPDYARFSR